MAFGDRNAHTGSRICFFAAGFGVAIWASLVPMVKQGIGANDAEFGLLLLALGIGSIAAMPVAAAVSARWGARALIISGAGGMMMMMPFAALANTYVMLVPLLLLLGASFGSLEVALNIEGTAVERHYGLPLMSNFHGFFSVGAVAGAAAMTGLLSLSLPPAAAAAAGSLVMLAATAFALPRLLPRTTGEAASLVFPRGAVVLLALLVAIAFLVEGAILDWGALLVIRQGLAEPKQAGVGFMIFSIAMTIGRFGGDTVAARIGNPGILVGGALIAAGGLALLLTATDGLIALGGFFLIGTGLSNLVPVLFRLAGRTTAMHPNMAIAALSSVASIGILAGPGSIGFLAHRFGLQSAFWFLAALLAFAGLIAWLVAARDAPAVPAPIGK